MYQPALTVTIATIPYKCSVNLMRTKDFYDVEEFILKSETETDRNRLSA
jgi:hypothetical protein